MSLLEGVCIVLVDISLIYASCMHVFPESCYSAIHEHTLAVMLPYFDELPFLRTSPPQMKCCPITNSHFSVVAIIRRHFSLTLRIRLSPKTVEET